ncbi:MAG: type II toxin-antitoxin system Phd/YefM family antitoxin [Peptococcaceae bacterium]|jgi:prevent-host-death family protein|nr:type II toxin-antitoxin system Phd/YefM family antitoxin [Peptococcaceae bacterium]
MDLRRVFDCMISVSELGRGQASKVIQAIEEQGHPYIVVKNNKPQAVIISINEYTELMRAKEMLEKAGLNDFVANHNHYESNIYEPNHYITADLTPNKDGLLTEDEINIFLEDEEND